MLPCAIREATKSWHYIVRVYKYVFIQSLFVYLYLDSVWIKNVYGYVHTFWSTRDMRRTSYIPWNAILFGRTWKFKTINTVDHICKRFWASSVHCQSTLPNVSILLTSQTSSEPSLSIISKRNFYAFLFSPIVRHA